MQSVKIIISLGPLVSYINKTVRHYQSEILLKVALNTTTLCIALNIKLKKIPYCWNKSKVKYKNRIMKQSRYLTTIQQQVASLMGPTLAGRWFSLGPLVSSTNKTS